LDIGVLDHTVAADRGARALDALLEMRQQLLRRPEVVEARVETHLHEARRDVGRLVADIDGGELQRRRLEVRAAPVDRLARPRLAMKRAEASAKAAIAPFMSAAPRPNR